MAIPLHCRQLNMQCLIVIYSLELYFRQCHKNSISPTRLIGCVWVELLKVGNGQPYCIVYLKRKGKLKTRGTNERKRLGTIPSLKGVATTVKKIRRLVKENHRASWSRLSDLLQSREWLLSTPYIQTAKTSAASIETIPHEWAPIAISLTCKPKSGVCKLL